MISHVDLSSTENASLYWINVPENSLVNLKDVVEGDVIVSKKR
jgi:hypothetical protein